MNDPRNWTDADWIEFDDRWATEEASQAAHEAITEIIYESDPEGGNDIKDS